MSLWRFQEAYRSKVTNDMQEMVQKHSRTIDSFLAERLGNLRTLVRTFDLPVLLDQAFLASKLAILREEYGRFFVDLGVVDPDGVQRSYAGPFNLANADYAGAAWFLAAKDREYYISDVFTGLRGTPHFIIAVRKLVDGRSWLVRATIDFEAFNSLVESIALGQTGFAFILNRAGQFQTRPRYEVNLNLPPFPELLAGRLDPGRDQVLEARDAMGRETLFAVARLKNGNWLLCLQQEESDAFAYLYQTERFALLVFGFSGLIILGLSFLVSRRLAARIDDADLRRTMLSDKVLETGRLASIGELAAGIAHEINNPVAIMVEEAGWIKDLMAGSLDEPATRQEVTRALSQIRTQGGRCREITHKLLSFARKSDSQVAEISLNAVVDEVLGLLQQRSRYAGVVLAADLDPELPSVTASPTELQQIILNLVNNAVDACGKTGGAIRVTTSCQGPEVVLQVADTGAGIPEVNLNRIFDPFFTTKPVGQGTGLGLSICYGIINKLGGEISVESVVDQGTTFTIRLPRAPEPAAGEDKAPGSRPGGGRS
ncbi:MAG: GHKL domain-containing protein [Deltaproteobacteria bacterium]|nr:GHKL domain-containing protein [Deltaproteobacteria bacterium]